jgi:protocatechuate 3,4-dioxygenase beta subunit
VTDVEGRFLLQAIPPGKAPLTVSASLQGAGKGRVEVPDGDAEVTIRLGGAGATDISLAGRIVGPDGEPVPGASLLLVETPGDDDTEPARYSRYLLRGGNRQLPVAADGTFSATGIYGEHRDRFLLVASVRGFLPGGTIVPVRAGATIRDVRVALRRGAEIRGVLRDDAGAPVAGMPVRAARAAPGNWGLGDGPATTATGDDGTFRLVVEPEVSVSIVFGAPGEEVLSLPAALPSTSLVEARLRRGEKSPAARQAELVARAEQARRMARQDEIPADWVRLTGRVVGPDGKPLDRAHVSHVVTDGRARASRGTSTDADGRFSIALPPGAAGTLDVDAQERGVARRLGVAAGAVEIEVRVLPRTEPVLRGVVRDGEGRPVAGAVVICTQDPRGPGALLRRSVDARNEEFERDRRDLRTLRTDADGAFRAATLPFGRWTVYAGRPGTPWFAGALTEVVVEDAAQPTAERDLRVVPGHVLRVRLLDAEGVARRGALVIVTQAKTAPETPIDFIVTTAADGEGRIELTGLPAGPWRVRVQGGSAPAAADVAESAEFTDLRL